MQQQQHNASALVAQYFARGGSVTQCKTRRARGIAYFAFTLQRSKHKGKSNYMRGNKRMA